MPASVPDHPAVNEAMQYCSACGKPVTSAIPDGDNRLRAICTACGTVHYQNPKIVAGCVPEHEGRILLCRRAIEPRRGYWTVPAGFMELGETVAAGAIRETEEEAGARIELQELFTVMNVVRVGQVHLFYRARMTDTALDPGPETLEARLFHEHEVPWDQIAFRTVKETLQHFFACRKAGAYPLHCSSI